MNGYEVGEIPPGLRDDGSFDTSLGTRAYSVIDEDGTILVVDKKTNKFIVDESETDDGA